MSCQLKIYELTGPTTATNYGKTAGALGASTYLVGGVFGVAGIGSESEFGQVTPADLEGKLRAMFNNTRTNLDQMGQLVLGRADLSNGGEYNFLPGQAGAGGEYPYKDNAIANFFDDGNMLLGAADTVFQDTLRAAFDTFRPRLVDQALVTGKFFVFVRIVLEL